MLTNSPIEVWKIKLMNFNKALDDLENLDVKLEDEDKAILLLNS